MPTVSSVRVDMGLGCRTWMRDMDTIRWIVQVQRAVVLAMAMAETNPPPAWLTIK